MTPDRIDEIRERMVAALYGELSPEETRALEARIAADETLQREWAELQAARAFLGEAPLAEPVPQFVFLEPASVARRGPLARGGADRRGWGWRWLNGLRHPVTGFAVATAALIVMVLAGLRVDRTPDGLMVHFASERPAAEATQPFAGGNQAGIPLEPQSGAPGDRAVGTADLPAQLASGDAGAASTPAGPYLTRAEFAAYANQLAAALEVGLNDYALRGRGETLYMLREVSAEFSRRQERDRDAIQQYIDELMVRLVAAGASGVPVPESGNGEAPVHGANPLESAPIRDLDNDR